MYAHLLWINIFLWLLNKTLQVKATMPYAVYVSFYLGTFCSRWCWLCYFCDSITNFRKWQGSNYLVLLCVEWPNMVCWTLFIHVCFVIWTGSNWPQWLMTPTIFQLHLFSKGCSASLDCEMYSQCICSLYIADFLGEALSLQCRG